MTAYQPLISYKNERCSICYQNILSEKEAVGHLNKNNELIHFVHETCVVPWLEIKRSCPACHIPIARSLRDRVVIITREMIAGFFAGIIIGVGIEITKEESAFLAIISAIVISNVMTRRFLVKPQVVLAAAGATLVMSLSIESAPLIPLAAAGGTIVSAYYSIMNR